MPAQILTQAEPMPHKAPPVRRESVAAARSAAFVERRAVARELLNSGALDIVRRLGLPMPTVTEAQWRDVDDIEALDRLLERHDVKKLHAWLRTLASQRGERLPCEGPVA